MTSVEERLKKVQLLDFGGKAEPFVESNFLTPLLECLGYETHKDYEVRRHGDDDTSFASDFSADAICSRWKDARASTPLDNIR